MLLPLFQDISDKTKLFTTFVPAYTDVDSIGTGEHVSSRTFTNDAGYGGTVSRTRNGPNCTDHHESAHQSDKLYL